MSKVAAFNSCLFVLYGQRELSGGGRRYAYWTPKEAYFQCFNPKRNEWNALQPTSRPHFASILLVVNEKLCVAGGQGDIYSNTGTPADSEASVEVYDQENNTWSVVEQNHIPPNNFRAVEIEERVYFIINNFPIDSGIRVPPGEVYPFPLDVFDEWENLGKVDKKAVLCYLPVNNESLKAE